MTILKKEELEKIILVAVKNVIEQFNKIEHTPKEIILSNCQDGGAFFKNTLENELKGRYDIPVVIDNGKNGYVIDVRNYLELFMSRTV